MSERDIYCNLLPIVYLVEGVDTVHTGGCGRQYLRDVACKM